MLSLLPLHADLTIHTETAFHIGTGRAEGLIQRTFRRDALGQPYIPGSSLKGALRVTAERLAATLDQHLLTVGFDADNLLGRRRRLGVILAEPCRGPRPETMCLDSKPCMVCRIFGNVYTGSRLRVADAVLEEAPPVARMLKKLETAEPETAQRFRARSLGQDVITHLQINRRRRTAQYQHLFTRAYTPAGLRFTTSLSGQVAYNPALFIPPVPSREHLLAKTDDLPPPVSLIFLAAVLRSLHQIGAHASTGHGHCHLAVDALHTDKRAWSVNSLVANLGDPLVNRLVEIL